MAALRRVVMLVSYGATIVLSALYQETLPFIGSLGTLLVRLSTALLIFLCLAMAATIHQSFPKEHEKASQFPKLYTQGAYAHCRHPLYLSLIILQFLIPLYMWSLEGLSIWLVTLVLWYALARVEEKELLRYWGRSYKEYMSRVRMFIPLRRRGEKGVSRED
jgi:protein-S-isoprenylcysteine O-methyltransferase Ste14